MALFDFLAKAQSKAAERAEELTKRAETLAKQVEVDPIGTVAKLVKEKKKHVRFAPDFEKSEYDNWLDFISCGGTSEEWRNLKSKKQWQFRDSETEKTMRHLAEVKKVADEYFDQMQKIENDWSVLYNLGSYTNTLADNLEKDCLENIANYNKMRKIDKKYGVKSPENIPAFRRLAMLYGKQGRYEESIEICKQAYSCGMDERSRMLRMIKKAGRNPTPEELNLLGDQ